MSMEYNSSDTGENTSVVGRETNPQVLKPVSPDSNGSFLVENDISTVYGDGKYGTMVNSQNGTYFFVNSETNENTFVDTNKQQIIVHRTYPNGDRIVTVYTTDPETSGYSVNASALGMGLDMEGNLEDPTLGVGVSLDPAELKAAYDTESGVNAGSASLGTFERDDVSSTAGYVDNFGSVNVVSGSFNRQNADGSVEEVSLFKDTFEGYVRDTDLYGTYIASSPETYTDLYKFDQTYDVFGSMSTDFNNSINNTIDANDASWGNISTSLNNILEQYKDAFQVGGLNISTVISPISESAATAKQAVEQYLEEVANEYSRIATKKREILAELAREEARKNNTSSN